MAKCSVHRVLSGRVFFLAKQNWKTMKKTDNKNVSENIIPYNPSDIIACVRLVQTHHVTEYSPAKT